MIQATIVTPDAKIAKREYEDVESFSKMLAELVTQGGNIIVRCPDDDTFLGVSGACALSQQNAVAGSKIVMGTSRPCWQASQTFTDGAGWRMVLTGVSVTSQPQPMPNHRPGMLNGRG